MIYRSFSVRMNFSFVIDFMCMLCRHTHMLMGSIKCEDILNIISSYFFFTFLFSFKLLLELHKHYGPLHCSSSSFISLVLGFSFLFFFFYISMSFMTVVLIVFKVSKDFCCSCYFSDWIMNA